MPPISPLSVMPQGYSQRPGIYEVWVLKNVGLVTELILKTDFHIELKHQLEPSPNGRCVMMQNCPMHFRRPKIS